MKGILFILMLVSALLSVSCAITSGQGPVPTMDINTLNSQIQDLQLKLDKAKSESSVNVAKINQMTDQIAKYQADVEKAQKLDNTNWVYPAKISYADYFLGVVCIYSIKVHNGSDGIKEFYVRTEPYQRGDNARTPKDIQDWVTYDGTSFEILMLTGKETRDVIVQFSQPLTAHFYSITDKGMDFANYLSLPDIEKAKSTATYPNINNIEKDVMTKLRADLTVSTAIVTANSWESSVQRLSSLGMIRDDRTYEYLTTFGESNPSGNVVARSGIRWTIAFSEFSK